MNQETYTINPSAISMASDMYAINRLVSNKIIKQQYISIYEILSDSSIADLELLIRESYMDNPVQSFMFSLLCMVAEGNELLVAEMDNVFVKVMKIVSLYILLTQGLIKCDGLERIMILDQIPEYTLTKSGEELYVKYSDMLKNLQVGEANDNTGNPGNT